jgi:hypothetical protein
LVRCLVLVIFPNLGWVTLTCPEPSSLNQRPTALAATFWLMLCMTPMSSVMAPIRCGLVGEGIYQSE